MADHPALRVAARLAALSLVLAATQAEAGALTGGKNRAHHRVALGPALERSVESPAPPARFFTIKDVLAKLDGEKRGGAQTQVAALDPAPVITDITPTPMPRLQSTEPFGLTTFRAPEGALWVRWRTLEQDLAAEAPVIARCRANLGSCDSPAARRFLAIVAQGKGLTGRARVAMINRAINSAILYMSDMAQYGVPDLWSVPLDTFTTGRGDCEDYAIAKYVALQEAGIAPQDLRLVLGRDLVVHQDHAVLAVRVDGQWLMLDNRHSLLIESREMKTLEPLFSLDDTGVSMLVAPYLAATQAGGVEVAPGNSSVPNWQNAEIVGGGSNIPLLM